MSNEVPLRILIVDDEPLMRWALGQTLRGCGHLVDEADSGAAALHLVSTATSAFDVVLLDNRLPDCAGLELLATIKHLAPRTQVILMSAFYTDEMADAALTTGAHRVLRKPIDMKDVAPLVRNLDCPPS